MDTKERAVEASDELNGVTEEDVVAVEGLIGIGRGAWDMVNHCDLIRACVEVMRRKE